MWKYTKVCVNPCRRKYAFPHVEIHMRSCISTCGNTPKILDFQTCGNTLFWCISTCRNSSGKANFRMSIYKRIREFPRGKTCGNTQLSGDNHMQKYTRKCEFPRAELHVERCITPCGNTLNQVQKNSSWLSLRQKLMSSLWFWQQWTYFQENVVCQIISQEMV